jgi:glycosyltransferase involved in cell wall biosynthesis
MSTHPRRVGVLAPPWQIPPKRYGGVEIAIDGLCRGLSAEGVKVFLWSHPDSTCPVHREAEEVTARPEDGWHDAITELRHVLAGYRWLAEQELDVILDITFAGPLLAANLSQVPVVTTNFLPFYPPSPSQTFPDVSLIYHEISLRVPVLAVSRDHARHAIGAIADVIPLGTEVDAVRPGLGRGDANGEYVLFLGRMAPEKGVVDAIHAARRAKARLKVAARMQEAKEIAYYRDQVEPLVDGVTVEYVGEPNLAEKTELLQGAGALVNPITWQEPFGLVMIETLAAGTPVIARRGGSVEEIVTAAVGAVCDSPDEVVEAIRARAQFSRSACRARAEEHFSYRMMTRRYLAYFEKVIASHEP